MVTFVLFSIYSSIRFTEARTQVYATDRYPVRVDSSSQSSKNVADMNVTEQER